VQRGRKTIPLKPTNPTFYHQLCNLYSTLPEYAADPSDPPNSNDTTNTLNNSSGTIIPVPSKFKINKQRRKFLAQEQKQQDNLDLNEYIDQHSQWS
jgi:hypothetical protein